MRVCNFASGSKGNCTYIETEKSKILVDMGISLSLAEKYLKELSIEPSDINAIIISHEHWDHTKGVKAFAKKYDADIYCHESLFYEIVSTLNGAGHNLIGFNSDFFIADMHIYPFALPHDSLSCHGFMVVEGNAIVSIVTDLGYMPNKVLDIIKSSTLVYLESNYDPQLLFACTKYPQYLKNRISSRNGHLSNIDCAKIVEILAQNGVKQVVLSHISENSNTELLAYTTVCEYLKSKGIAEGTHIRVDVAHQYKKGTVYKIKNNTPAE